MSDIDRWRRWRPSDEIIGEPPEQAPTKPPEPTFEGFDGGIPRGIPDISDPSEWSDVFGRWALEQCVYRPDRGDCGGLNTLHSSFCDWCITNREVPCRRDVFKALLLDEGFTVTTCRGIEMVSGLILRADFWALEPPNQTGKE
jgi:hypothetical protein